MNGTAKQLAQPLAYRVWDPDHHSFFHTDVFPDTAEFLDRWTGFFDRQGAAIYEGDILRAHYDWRYGWVRAVVVRDATRREYKALATDSEGRVLKIGFYDFAEAYLVGNIREHPHKLKKATEQFAAEETEPWWLSTALFRSVSGTSFN